MTKVALWTDSTTVLQWIRAAKGKQPVFVGNRVGKILESSTIDQWHHVPGELNPADIVTRGLPASDLVHSQWLSGPDFLKSPNATGPNEFRSSRG